ncbi:hypothetical protein SAMN06296378_2422, partial [Salinibacterium xinjiangense]
MLPLSGIPAPCGPCLSLNLNDSKLLVLNAKQPPWLFFNSWGGYFTMESGGVLLSH